MIGATIERLPQETRLLIEQIRFREPVRRVKSSGLNVRGDYASSKMGKTIQFESHKVELPGIEEYEEDPDVLEYYDQPYQLTLFMDIKHWENNKGFAHPVISLLFGSCVLVLKSGNPKQD